MRNKELEQVYQRINNPSAPKLSSQRVLVLRAQYLLLVLLLSDICRGSELLHHRLNTGCCCSDVHVLPVLMVLVGVEPWHPPEELANRYNNNLCLVCGAATHFRDNYPEAARRAANIARAGLALFSLWFSKQK
jgi:hypothetical protein